MPFDHQRWHFDPVNNFGLAPGYFERFADMPESWKLKYIKGLWIFTQEGDNYVYPQALVDLAFELDLPFDTSEPGRYGLDPAGTGSDNASLTFQRGPRFAVHSRPRTTGPELGWFVDDVTRKFGRFPIRYDAGGLGAPNGEYLAKPRLDRDGVTAIPPHQVVKVDTRHKPRKPEKYVDFRTEQFWAVRDRMKDRIACFEGEEKTLARLREQFMALQFEPDNNGRPKVESKKTFKARTGMSPDELEGVVYANTIGPKPMTLGVQG
jgi:hypothetical protein